ncbi:hypothetical protein NON00_22175 [Roseomonas sp. GC11]|uniref:hypothetical protein n=1 Tax=Roseomonas sp. GC11 TaxID=2950546 RepID=UPI002109992A|nr:hypothetical protein [Roseomonas sp. GC11]MCQ4162619.1 hypothetical protein [Roseomonas sp. GC11]
MMRRALLPALPALLLALGQPGLAPPALAQPAGGAAGPQAAETPSQHPAAETPSQHPAAETPPPQGLEAPAAFADLSHWNGEPAAAARACAVLERLAETHGEDPFFIPPFPPAVMRSLEEARAVLRERLGIDPEAQGEEVVIALDNAAAAIEAGDKAALREALAPPLFRLEGAEVVARLASLPAIPQAAAAARAVEAELRHRVE